MHERKGFWDKNAGRYDRFMRNDRAAYEKMYGLIRPVVKAKTVLEVATGTGLIAKSIVNAAAHIEATDASAKMILEAKRDNQSAKLHFSVQDMFRLPYAQKSFDAVIASNALHIVPHPEKALQEIRRVLKDDGVLIAPTFTHAGSSVSGKAKAFFMSMAGFPLHSRWTSEEYLRFLRQNGWAVQKSAVLKKCPHGVVKGIDYSPVSVEKTRKLNRTAIQEGRCAVLQGSVADMAFEDAMRAFLHPSYTWR